jgi:Fe-S-cluster containining protein
MNEMPQETISCDRCEAACCRDVGDGTALVSAEDIVRWKRDGAQHVLATLVPGHFSQQGFATHANGTCVHLGIEGRPHDCSIYSTRGESCRALEPGSSQCLTYRRRHYERRVPEANSGPSSS